MWVTPAPRVVGGRLPGQRLDFGGRLGWLRGPGLGVLVHRAVAASTPGPYIEADSAAAPVVSAPTATGSGAPCGRALESAARLVRPGAVLGDVAVELDDGLLLAAQVDEQRRRDEDRGVGADRDADEQREREVEQGARPEQGEADEEHGRDRQQRHDGRVDRAHEGLVHGEVGGVRVGHAPGREGLGGVLAHLVEDDDRVVERVAEDREEADHRRRRDLEPEERVDADGDDEVVEQRDETGDSHLPRAEVERHDDGHEDEEDDEAPDGLLADRLTPARADERGADRASCRRRRPGEGGAGLVGALGRPPRSAPGRCPARRSSRRRCRRCRRRRSPTAPSPRSPGCW